MIKLQAREKTLVGQVKLKTRILNEQEKVMKERETEIDALKAECKEGRSQLNEMTGENKELKATLQKKTVELDEAAKLLKRDENIISWLNKQITDNNLASSGKMVNYDSTMPSSNSGSAGLFKPFGALSLSSHGHGHHTSLSNANNEVESLLHSNSLGSGLRSAGALQSTTNLSQNHYMSHSGAATQMPMYSSGSGTGGSSASSSAYPQQHQTSTARALSSASSSSIQQSDTLKENHDM